MKKIIIKNLGPIEHFSMDIKRVNILIGPQASGKSTIAKAFFLVNSVQKELIRHIQNISTVEERNHLLKNFNKSLKFLFVNTFGNSRYMPSFEIIYKIDERDYIKFYSKDGWVMLFFSENIKKRIEQLKEEIDILIQIDDELHSNPLDENLLAKKTYIYGIINRKINEIFKNNLSFDYIPAGRNLLTILSEQLGALDIGSLDLVTKNFIEKILSLKKLFYQDLDSIIDRHKKLSSQKIDFPRVYLAKDIILRILKGDYRIENGHEFIYLKNGKSVKINFASSGQQEALWILNSIFYFILYAKKIFLIIEEPEAHLYPFAQKDITQLLALFTNTNYNQILITTHSPYILESINNLIYAKNIYKKGKNISSIPKELVIDFSDLNAFMIKGGKDNYQILDKGIGQIKSEEIDRVSKFLNDEFEKLLELEL